MDDFNSLPINPELNMIFTGLFLIYCDVFLGSCFSTCIIHNVGWGCLLVMHS